MILVVDNYDSFTYNLVQAVGKILQQLPDTHDIRVARNDKITLEEIEALAPAKIIISPGPCTPKEAGISTAVVRTFAGTVPLLGVCLGHQCIGEAFGGDIVRAARLMHGKTSMIKHDGRHIFTGLANPFEATRYHSLIIQESTMPACLEVTARTVDRDEVMAVRHTSLAVEGVQFHPESFLTLEGEKLLKNFLTAPPPPQET